MNQGDTYTLLLAGIGYFSVYVALYDGTTEASTYLIITLMIRSGMREREGVRGHAKKNFSSTLFGIKEYCNYVIPTYSYDATHSRD